jgi:hypothetical protein
MDSLLFLAVLIGTTWLCFWSLQDQRGPKRPWSPFDARHIGDVAEDAPKPSGRRAGPSPRPWQRAAARRGAAGRPIPEPPPWRRRSDS